MPAAKIFAFIASTALVLFVVIFASMMRLSHIDALAGRRADGSPSLEAIIHSVAKLIFVLVLTLALSRVLLAPSWPGGPFAPDLAMLAASITSLIVSLPAAAIVALISGRKARPRFVVLAVATVAAIVSSGAGQVAVSAIAAGRDLGALLAPSTRMPLLACGVVGCAGFYIHARLVRELIASPRSVPLILADTALTALTTVFAIWMACLAYPVGK